MGSAAGNPVDAGISGSVNPTTSVSKSFVEDSQRIRIRLLNDLASLLRNVDWKRFASEMVRQLDLPAQAVMRWFGDQGQFVSAETGSVTGIGKKVTTTRWDSLPTDLQADVLQNVDSRDRFYLKGVSSGSKKFILESDDFRQSRCSGYDLHSKSWWSFSTVSSLPPLDAELFKEYSVCGHGGLMCAEVTQSPMKGELVLLNPLTGKSETLPPLLHPRNPVLVHISVDSAKKSFKVIVAGSSAASDEHLSKKVEVFDSSTSKWKELCDLPGPAFGLNEHEAGVCLNGKLLFVSFLEKDCRRGVVALDVENETWLQDLATPIPWSSSSDTAQLIESDGKLFLFSEQEPDQSVDDCCIDELDFQNPKAGTMTCRWRSFVKVKKSGGRGLQVFPENTCVGFGAEKPGMFSPLSRMKLKILLASCFAFLMPMGAWAGDQSMAPLSGKCTSNAWETPDFARKAAVTLLVGLTMVGARVAWGIFRRRQDPVDRFAIDEGLQNGNMQGLIIFAAI